MEKLPAELSLKIFSLLDHQNLAAAQQVCRDWNSFASENYLWYNLFEKRWGGNRAAFYAPRHTKSWKEVYEVQDRCDRVGLGLKIIREGNEYYLVHQGEIQRCLGSRRSHGTGKRGFVGEKEGGACIGVLDKILFFIGDLEVATRDAKRCRSS